MITAIFGTEDETIQRGDAMMHYCIDRITVSDIRYRLPPGAGSDAVHPEPEYCLAVTQLFSADGNTCGTRGWMLSHSAGAGRLDRAENY
jgi:hypothetical protein